jgi:hypothetical protein
VPVAGAFLTTLLGIIAFFLARLIGQFDNLAIQFSTLNTTMLKIDGDLSGDMGVLKSEHVALKLKMDGFDPMWDRVRAVENGLLTMQTKCSSVIHHFKSEAI